MDKYVNSNNIFQYFSLNVKSYFNTFITYNLKKNLNITTQLQNYLGTYPAFSFFKVIFKLYQLNLEFTIQNLKCHLLYNLY